MSTITENIAAVRSRIAAAAQASQRLPESIGLLAVSKTHSASAIEDAYRAGLCDLGENYLQEALEKQAQLSHLPLTWHFLGNIFHKPYRASFEAFLFCIVNNPA